MPRGSLGPLKTLFAAARRVARGPIAEVGIALAAACLIRAQSPKPPSPQKPATPPPPAATQTTSPTPPVGPPGTEKSRLPPPTGPHRQREGTEILDQLGYFKVLGDRIVFFTDKDTQRFVGLENLNLERIARTVTNNPQQLEWKVSGTITEFRGNNFILIDRAILKGGTQRREDAAF